MLHRVSFDWRASEGNSKRNSDLNFVKTKPTRASFHYCSSGGSIITAIDAARALKRRTNAQVTRMLLAVTLTLIMCNIPNTIYFVFVKIYDTRQLLNGRLCENISDDNIKLYKFGFYSSVIQDMLSDLPHMVNFFLYCLAGKRFRDILLNEIRRLLYGLRLIHTNPNNRRFTYGICVSYPEFTRGTSVQLNHEFMRGTSVHLNHEFTRGTNAHLNYEVSTNRSSSKIRKCSKFMEW